MPGNVVLRLALDLAPAARGGRRSALRDGYRASLSFGRRRRGVEPIVHDAVLVLEGAATEVAPGASVVARAWLVDALPRDVGPGDVFTLLEGDRIVARATLLERLFDRAPRPLDDVAAAKIRPLMSVRKHVVETYVEGFRASDHDAILGCLTDDVTWDMPPLFSLSGKRAFQDAIEDEATPAPPDLRVNRLIEEGDVVVAEGEVQVPHAGEDGVDALFCVVFEFRGDRICRLVTYQVDRHP